MNKTTKKLSVAVLFLAMSTGSAFAQKKTATVAPKAKTGKTIKPATGVILPTPQPDYLTHYDTKAACKKVNPDGCVLDHTKTFWYPL